MMQPWWNSLLPFSRTTSRRGRSFTSKCGPLAPEALEDRLLLSSAPLTLNVPSAFVNHTVLSHGQAAPAGSAGPVGYSPSQVRHAYGFDQISFSNGTVVGDGKGQTIAIIDAYDDPTIGNDLKQFDATFGLADPSFTKVSQTGSTTSLPAADSTGGWETEEALDVEWAHAMAPGANILLVEANSSSFSDLNTAVNYARNQPGVAVVSMSYGGSEFSGESSYDSYFTTPTGHSGVTFVASTGDSGAPAEYPAASPNVVAVGGTTLTIDTSGNYVSESGWSSGGGGISPYEAQPAYQQGIVTQSTTARTNPDVAFDADPNSGVAVYDSYNQASTPWMQVGGTSLSAPSWAGLLAVADQGRVLNNEPTLDGVSGTLPDLYKLPSTDFHDVSTGSNGYSAGIGYDLVTGRGSPLANLVVSDLVQPPSTSGVSHLSVTTPSSSVTAGNPFSITVTAQDANNNTFSAYTGTVHFSSSDSLAGLPADYTFTAADNGVHTFTVSLKTAGAETVTATDRTLASVTGQTGVTVNAGAVSRIVIGGFPSTMKAGNSNTFSVSLKDAYGNAVTGYTGTVHFTSSDSQAQLPADYTFTTADAGKHYFSAVLKTAGTETLTVTDRSTPSLTGSQSIVVNPNSLNRFKLVMSGNVTAGTPFQLTVVPVDAYGNTITGYRGTVHFSSGDKLAKLPGNYTFTASDNGSHTFWVTLGTTGTQYVNVNDTANLGISTRVYANVTTGTTSAATPKTATSGTTTTSQSGSTLTQQQVLQDLFFTELQLLSLYGRSENTNNLLAGWGF